MTVTIRTEDLAGPALDWAVARARGLAPLIYPSTYGTGPRVFVNNGLQLTRWKPSEDRAQGWALLDEMTVKIVHFPGATAATKARVSVSMLGHVYSQHGPTPLIALCRAVTACIHGDAVRVPAELLEQGERP